MGLFLGVSSPARRADTAVQDDEDFTGAGLYDSRSARSADDVDLETTEKPCGWDLGEPNERDVLSVIQKADTTLCQGPEHFPEILPETLTPQDDTPWAESWSFTPSPSHGFQLGVENPRASSSAWRGAEHLA